MQAYIYMLHRLREGFRFHTPRNPVENHEALRRARQNHQTSQDVLQGYTMQCCKWRWAHGLVCCKVRSQTRLRYVWILVSTMNTSHWVLFDLVFDSLLQLLC